MHHKRNNNNNSTDKHDRAQHDRVPSMPAPGGSSTPAPQKSSYLQRLKEKFKKPEEKPATKEEVMQLRLNAQREQARFMHKNYVKKSKELGGGSGWSKLFSEPSSPKGRRSTGSNDLGFFTSSNDNAFGSGEGALGMFGAGPKPKGVRSKQPDEWGSLKDMF